MGTWIGIGLAAFLAAGSLLGQIEPMAAQQEARPLPDVDVLMHEVEDQQKVAEGKEKDYLYRENEEVQELDKNGAVKTTETKAYDIFWVEGVVVRRLVSEDGEELTEKEKAKEAEAVDKEVKKARDRKAKAEQQGKVTDPNGDEEITVPRMLQLGSFSNPRRQTVNGRSTILVDFTGDPKAKTHNPMESAIHDLQGTVWVDEADRAVEHMEFHFFNDFKLGGGLLVNVKKNTSFSLTQTKVNDEVWLPQELSADGQARVLLLMNLNGRLRIHDGEFRKFRASSTLLPASVTEPK